MNAAAYRLACERQCLRLLRASSAGNNPHPLSDLADATSISLDKARQLARLLVRDELWARQGRGRYTLTPKGAAAVRRIRTAG